MPGTHLYDRKDLLRHELQDLYGAEVQQIQALPAALGLIGSQPIRTSMEAHLSETRAQHSRLQKIARRLEIDISCRHNQVIQAMIGELTELLQGRQEEDEAALLTILQKIEHYEINGYGSAYHCAKLLGYVEVCYELFDSLTEEKNSCAALARTAEEQQLTLPDSIAGLQNNLF